MNFAGGSFDYAVFYERKTVLREVNHAPARRGKAGIDSDYAQCAAFRHCRTFSATLRCHRKLFAVRIEVVGIFHRRVDVLNVVVLFKTLSTIFWIFAAVSLSTGW